MRQARIVKQYLVVLMSFAAVGCHPSFEDDRDARLVLNAILSGDTLSAVPLEPGTRISALGWGPFLAARKDLPEGSPDSIALTKWETVRDHYGQARVMTYEVRRDDEYAVIEIWLTKTSQGNVLNGIRTFLPRDEGL